ncbi:hypothetical protein [Bradyrhizobium icense]|uniref:Uncharacterized protein n=1 Tax=Bradyrhizobium icense TaxID=1274631 RepID=A0A1B1UJ85_9BRAD|nr:hypothetical protein [Bradyrhizobium icense]ANW02826.1 hypothetical protein LMTR13_24400 [Bradyrhizobium icense]
MMTKPIIALDDAARTLALVKDRWLAAGEYRRGIDGARHGFTRNSGGVVVSSSEDRRIRFQCAPSSTLSKQLEEIGFKPVSVGTTEPLKSVNLTQRWRTVSETVVCQYDGITQMVVYEFPMPIRR